MPEPDETPRSLRGFQGFDLAAPMKTLMPAVTPLRETPEMRRRARAERLEREQRIALEAREAEDEWRRRRDRHQDNPVARAAFDLHRPQAGYGQVECAECREADYDGAVPVSWPCGTYRAMREADTE